MSAFDKALEVYAREMRATGDDIVDAFAVAFWAAKWAPPVTLQLSPEADFRRRMRVLRGQPSSGVTIVRGSPAKDV